jgi:thiamine kinase-like enzyme
MTMLDLDTYTDADAMRPLLQRGLRGLGRHDLRIHRLEVLHALRRAPRRNPASAVCRIAVCYAAEIGEAESPQPRCRQILYGKVYPSAFRAAEPGAQGAWLDEIDMQLWSFPDDPGLPQLPALLDPARVARLMPASVLKRIDGAAARRMLTAEVVRYRPEERAMLRWHLPGGGALYAKTFNGAGGAELQRRFEHFARAADAEGAFAVAPPLGYDPGTMTFWQDGITAQALPDAINHDNCATLMAAAACGLAQLHGTALQVPLRRRHAELCAAAAKRALKIARCMPELAAAAQEAANRIASFLPDLAEPHPRLIHGDFHLDQLRLRGDGRLVVFDFDELAMGDVLEDLASFVVKLTLADAALAQRAGDELLAAYARCRPADFDASRFNWHLSVQWLLKASRTYVWQRPGWRQAAADMVSAAGRCAALVHGCRARAG